jgi:hypothetical protein
MARYNEILVGRYNRFIQKLFGMKGGPPSPQLASEITVAFGLFNDVGNRYLEGWDTFAAFASQAGAATFQSAVQMRNPVGSNVLCEFLSISTWNTLADQPLIKIYDPAGADLNTLIVLSANRQDRRGKPNPSIIQSRSNTNGALGGMQQGGSFAANGAFQFIGTDIQMLPLLPGDALAIQSGIVNQTLNVSFLWRERFLEDSERT